MKILLQEQTKAELLEIRRKLEGAIKRNSKTDSNLQSQQEQLEKLTKEVVELEKKLDPTNEELVEKLDRKQRQIKALEKSITNLEGKAGDYFEAHAIIAQAKDTLLIAAGPIIKAQRQEVVEYLAPLFGGDTKLAGEGIKGHPWDSLLRKLPHRINLLAGYPEHSGPDTEFVLKLVDDLLKEDYGVFKIKVDAALKTETPAKSENDLKQEATSQPLPKASRK